jgi:hypothetical protein
MIKKVLLFFCLITVACLCLTLIPGVVSAQVATPNPNEYQEEIPVLLKNEYTAGINFHSYGWGLLFRRAKNKTVSKKRFLEVEFLSMKHPKEIRSVNPYVENAKSYIYGKLNTFLILRTGYGRQRVLYDKADKGGVAIRFNYGGGFSLGFTKPIYLNILEKTANPFEYRVVTEKYNPEQHFISNIYGRASFTYGMTEMRLHPGLYAKMGMSFEYSRNHDDIKALEVGMALDAYPKKVPIMAFAENKQVFFIFYINVLFGKRWK